MFTLKLQRPSGGTKLVSGSVIDVTPNGRNDHVAVTNEGITEEFVVGKGEEYCIAYVENSQGSTTQIVRGR